MGYKVGQVVLGGYNPPDAFEDDYEGDIDLTLDTLVRPVVGGYRVQHTNTGHITQPLGQRARRLTFGGVLPGPHVHRSQLAQLIFYCEQESIVEVSRLFPTPSAAYNEVFIGHYHVERVRPDERQWRAGLPDLVRWSCTLVEATKPLPAEAVVARG